MDCQPSPGARALGEALGTMWTCKRHPLERQSSLDHMFLLQTSIPSPGRLHGASISFHFSAPKPDLAPAPSTHSSSLSLPLFPPIFPFPSFTLSCTMGHKSVTCQASLRHNSRSSSPEATSACTPWDLSCKWDLCKQKTRSTISRRQAVGQPSRETEALRLSKHPHVCPNFFNGASAILP